MIRDYSIKNWDNLKPFTITIQVHFFIFYFFSLFAYSQVLDTILFREKGEKDLPEYEETQRVSCCGIVKQKLGLLKNVVLNQVLKELIINPLRENNFVRADRIMQLRQLLDKLGSVTGMVSEEKDPEEFLNTLLVQVNKLEHIYISSFLNNFQLTFTSVASNSCWMYAL